MVMKYQDGKFYPYILYEQFPHIGGINGDVQSDIYTLLFKQK